MTNHRTVCVVIHNRANYARIKSFLSTALYHPNLDLKIIAASSTLLYRFGQASNIIEKDGFTLESSIHNVVEGDTPCTMAKSTGLAIIELATQFQRIKPDVVLTVADRYETMATAIASSYMNIPLAHTQGGELTGSIDDSVRHSITKLSHIHFPATHQAAQVIRQMGENPASIFTVGCPSLDLLVGTNLDLTPDFFNSSLGVGAQLQQGLPYLLVLQHPVTTEYGSSSYQIHETFTAVSDILISNPNLQVIWLWPNIDAGSDSISKYLRQSRENGLAPRTHFYRNFSAEDYARVLKNCSVIVGNSSSGLREASFLGIPCVNIGSRQKNRERSSNVINATYDSLEIKNAILYQLSHGLYEPSYLYGRGTSGQQITNILSSHPLSINKSFHSTL